MVRHYDAIVIGSGPAGEGAAMSLVKGGKSVCMIEKNVEVGGNCTHKGTIPSKSLRHEVQQLAMFRNNARFNRLVGPLHIEYSDLLKSASRVIEKQVRLRESFYFRNRVDIITGHAKFVDKKTVQVLSENNTVLKTISADHFVISTGSRPYRPADVDFTHPRIYDSDTILDPKINFKTITIYGAGVIGCEYASIMGSLGINVNLINNRTELLSFLDTEITDALSYNLRQQGVTIRHNETYETISATDEGVTIITKSGKSIKDEAVLWANGRSGNTENMGLEEIGISPNHRGQIDVNSDYQTNNDNIYAVGDVIGFPSLASASYDQGRFAATHILEGKCDDKLVTSIPTGIYTSPEISSIGKTEVELTNEGVPFEVGRAFFKSIARAQITGQTVGVLKILFHTETLEILGIHCFGQGAAEIIHIGQAIMAQPGEQNTLEYFVNTTFNYPTMAEAYRVAALNGLNRV